MSEYPNAAVYVGVKLGSKEAMRLFGAKYEEKIRDVCPKDKVPNSLKKGFCSDCGTNLRFKNKVSDGIDDLSEIESLDSVERLGLDTYLSEPEGRGEDQIVIGRKVAEKDFFDDKGPVVSLEGKVDKAYKEMRTKLPKLSINQPVQMYLVAYMA